MAILISVGVCTYNRAEFLKGAIQSLCNQTLHPSFYEIIIVDNNSKDNTHAVADEFCRCYPNVRYCLETEQGLSHARNRSWREARGEYVAYIDDDCKVPEQWLAVAKDIIERVSPSVFGGPFYPFYNTAKPRWYKDSYGSHEPFKEARILNGKECIKIYGGNMFFCTRLLKTMGGFKARLGMSGNNIGYGEETDMHLMIHAKMPDELFYYDPNLYVYHLVQGKKLTLRWMMYHRFVSAGHAYQVFHNGRRPEISRVRLCRGAVENLLGFVLSLTLGVLRCDRTNYPYIQNYLCENTFQYLRELGLLYEQYRQVIGKSESSRLSKI